MLRVWVCQYLTGLVLLNLEMGLGLEGYQPRPAEREKTKGCLFFHDGLGDEAGEASLTTCDMCMVLEWADKVHYLWVIYLDNLTKLLFTITQTDQVNSQFMLH